jgi:GTP cyclohydrolase II
MIEYLEGAIKQLKDLVEDVISINPTINKYNRFYLKTKKDKLNHAINI